MKNKAHQEELDSYKESIDIRDYLKSSGYKIDKDRDTKRYQAFTSEQSGDKIYVPINNKYPNANYYVNQFDHKDKGTIVDFVMSRQQKTLDEARLALREFQHGYIPTSSYEKVLPDEAKQARHQFIVNKIAKEHATGTNELYIEKRLLDHDTRNHAAFQDKIKLNEAPDERFVAFPMQDGDGKITGVAMKSNTRERFLGNRSGVWISHPTQGKKQIDKVVITEHPIDAMSYYQLRPDKEKNVIYLSTAGNPSQQQVETLSKHIKSLEPKEIVLANDNDPAGRKYDQLYTKALQPTNIPVSIEKSEFKDWNADIYAQQMYKSRLLDRSNDTPQQIQLDHKVKATSEIEEALESKKYDSLSVEDRKKLPSYYVERNVEGKKVEFSLSEVAAINNDKKLMKELDQAESLNQEYLASQTHKAKSAAKQLQHETEILQAVPESNDAKLKRLESTKEQTMVGRQALQEARNYIDHQSNQQADKVQKDVSPADRPGMQYPLGATPGVQYPLRVTPGGEPRPKDTKQIEPADEFTKIKNEYDQQIDSLQGQIKGQPEHEKMARRLTYYKSYPHLNDQEVDTYLSIEDKMQSQQQGHSHGLGRQKDREIGL